MLLRLISLITGYNLILSESQIIIPGGETGSAGYAIIQAVHHPDIILYADGHQKTYEHILETGPNTYFIKKMLPRFWQKTILQNQKPATELFDSRRALHRYRRGGQI
jgi:hypothetical protein